MRERYMTEITIINLTITLYYCYISLYNDSWRYISLSNVRWQSFCQNDDTSNVIFVVMKVFLSLVSSRFDSLSKLLSRPMMGLSGYDEGEVFGFGVFWGFGRGWSLRGRGTIDDKLWWVEGGVNQASSNVVEWALGSVLAVK